MMQVVQSGSRRVARLSCNIKFPPHFNKDINRVQFSFMCLLVSLSLLFMYTHLIKTTDAGFII